MVLVGGRLYALILEWCCVAPLAVVPGRAAPLSLGVEVDAVVVRVPSHVVPVRKGCHRQWRRHLHTRSLVFDTEYLPASSPTCSSLGQTSTSRSPSPLQRTQMRTRGASRSPRFAPDVRTVGRTRSTPHCRRCVVLRVQDSAESLSSRCQPP